MLATSTRPPTVEEVKKLTITDLAIASGLADSLRDRLREFVQIDPFTQGVADPFGEKDDCTYSVVLDRENPNRVVAIIVNKKDSMPQLPWSAILGERLAKVSMEKSDARELKRELAPKEWGNFYPYRRAGKVAGYFMFAFQICGQR
ncbi:MAG: hypothetical protein QXJ74_08100 [Nitrososphaera sp.]|uniref:hypothetical protein n=1 Tax=Nitrososphaera sp. TaxID=1971748 RepID=UPI00317F1A70